MRLLYVCMLCLLTNTVLADWWRTPEQLANDALEAGDFDTLSNIAPDAQWQAIAKHKNEEFENAANAFGELASQKQIEGDLQAANRALYNQGVSQVRAGAYEDALANFEQVLQSDPEFEDALHNRDIAEQLVQQQQQQEQSGDQGEESSSDQGEQSSSEQESSEGEQSEETQSDDGNESSPSEEGNEQSEDTESASDEQQQRDAQAARDALDAEREAEQEANEGITPESPESIDETMSESEQATEQWLRRIPDDPAGLLRRKLEQSHQTEFPEVRDAVNPW